MLLSAVARFLAFPHLSSTRPRQSGNGVTPTGVPDPFRRRLSKNPSKPGASGRTLPYAQRPRRGAGLAGHVLPRRAGGGTANGAAAHAPRGRPFAPAFAVPVPALLRGAGNDGTGRSRLRRPAAAGAAAVLLPGWRVQGIRGLQRILQVALPYFTVEISPFSVTKWFEGRRGCC